jgi:hypothetical protein
MADILKAGVGNTTQRRHLSKPSPTNQKQVKTSAKTSGVALTRLMKKYPGPELATLVDKQPNGDA